MTTPEQSRLFLKLMDVPHSGNHWEPWLKLCCELIGCDDAALICWKAHKPDEKEIFSTSEWKSADFGWVDFADIVFTRKRPAEVCFLADLLDYVPGSQNQELKIQGPVEDLDLSTLLKTGYLTAVVGWSDIRAILILHRHHSDWLPEELHAVSHLLPFIQKTILQKKEIERGQMALFLANEILDSAPRGIAVLLSNGYIGYTNAKAKIILDARDGIAELDGKIRLNDTDNHLAVYQQLKKICDPENNDPDADGFDLSVDRPSGKSAYQLVLRRLVQDPGSVDAPNALKRAVVYFHDPAQQHPLVTDQLKRFYSLTEAQATLAAVMYEGESVNGAARKLGISVNTARTHLRRIYTKIGAANQAEFLREMARSLKLTNRPNH